METINAIRSLQCEDHAVNLPPRELSVSWFLGKRCNYDCSYCSPHIHDAVSPFADVEKSKHFVDAADRYCLETNKKIKWSFTGGEPFIDPGFVQILDHIKSKKSTSQVNAISNGSLSTASYLQTAGFLKGITFSLHLERTRKEIERSLLMMQELKAQTDLFLSVNLMFLPGKIELVKYLGAKLDRSGIPFVVRKITPNHSSDDPLPYLENGVGRKDRVVIDKQQQSMLKTHWKITQDRRAVEFAKSYYSDEELGYLEQANDRPVWQNMGIWTENDYCEINSDILVAQKRNNFLGWTCYAGVDHINIDFDGKIYAAQCQNKGAIGNISASLPFANDPMICELNWCTCNTDIPIRKARSPDYLFLINHD